ncbi:MAG TPA: GNAT family N-acetyltransferase [Vicinamibacterales bacterium]|nr:GNAT family N-acetyltransferase [Vicinamibacterales bacterium]
MSVAIYPSDVSTDTILRDGTTVRLRAVRDDDAARVLALFGQLSERSLYYRFMSVPHIDLAEALKIVTIDYDSQMIVVAERGDALCGIAGYYRDPACPERAEVAFAVADAMQGRGLGTRLLERLAEIARDRGVRAFDAYVLGDNLAMMDVFLQSGFALTQGLDKGMFHVALDLQPTPVFESAAGRRSQLAAAASLRPFFEPRCIAVVGANQEPGHIGSEIFRNLQEGGYTGTLVPVHPRAESIRGLRAYPNVKDIPGDVDLAVIVVRAAKVAAIVDDCLAKGVKALVVISAGFGEMGPEGESLQAELVEKIRAAGVRMIGPNCMGIINTNPAFSINATFSPVAPAEGRVAFSTQSGALGLAILDYVKRLNIGISSFASIGNKADVSGNDLLQYWAEDPRTDVILLYLESFGNPRKFAEIARRVGRTKPILAVKAGRSDAGARAASSHTGARASSEVLVETMLREAGVIRTRTLEELFDAATLLAHQPVPGGNRVAVVTNAGGPAILAVDACEANGLRVPVLAEPTQRALRAFLPPAASVGNPVDMIASATPEQYRRALEVVAADPSIDSVIAIFIPPLVTEPEAVAAAIRGAAAQIAKPMLATFLGTHGLRPQLAPVPSFAFPEAAATALAHVTRYGEWLRNPIQTVEPLCEDVRTKVRAFIDATATPHERWLTPVECEALLGLAGMPVVRSRTVGSAEEAVAAAREVGFPAVLKAVGKDIVHKSDVGGVRVNLASEQAVRDAFAVLATTLGDRIDAVLVQPMITGGIEMVVGGVNDPAFGPVVMCGTGGVLVDVLDDTAFAMCPLAECDARALVERVKGRVRLRGFRGTPASDESAFRRLLVRASQLLHECPEIREMDLNPVMVLPAGAVIADVRIRVGSARIAPAGRRIRH